MRLTTTSLKLQQVSHLFRYFVEKPKVLNASFTRFFSVEGINPSERSLGRRGELRKTNYDQVIKITVSLTSRIPFYVQVPFR